MSALFGQADRLLLQAKELFNKGNYQGTKQLAKQAEKGLDTAEERLREAGQQRKG